MKKILQKIKTFLLGSFLFLGLPLIAWNLNETNTFYENSIRATYSIIVLILNAYVADFIPTNARGVGEGIKLQKKHKISLLGLQVIPLSIVILAPYFDNASFYVLENEYFRLIGLISFCIGFLVMNWSAYLLGKQFSTDVTIQKDHQLIKSGLFSIIRHPRYLGIMLTFMGISLVFKSIISLVLVAFLILLLFWRIMDEEKLLQEEFGEEWTKYKAKSKKLIPYIY